MTRESFNGSLKDELLNSKTFYSHSDARGLIKAWPHHYDTVRPHSSASYRPPAPKAATPPLPVSGFASLHLRLVNNPDHLVEAAPLAEFHKLGTQMP